MSNIESILQSQFAVSSDDIGKAKELAKGEKISFMQACEKLKFLDAEKLLEAFGQFFQVKTVTLETSDIPKNILELIPVDVALKFRAIPIDRAANNLVLAVSNPKDLRAIDTIRFKTRFNVKPVLALEADLTIALERYYSNRTDLSSITKVSGGDNTKTKAKQAEAHRTVVGKNNEGSDTPIIKVVNFMLRTCLEKKASDIHIEPYEDYIRIRMRMDGSLVEITRPPNDMKDALISRIKIMAQMNIAEKRKPQDGSINVLIDDKPIDFRVNSVPTVFGEKIVCRILDKSSLEVDMTKLGFAKYDLANFKEAISRPYGMVLVTGPTGSGKTVTLYSALAELNKETENIMTGEDPVEFQVAGINQVQMQPDVGLDFAAALRAFLRQDPDVIMVGEIRDLETAQIAMKAALTGHMVLSTLHTNSAADTIVRLLNMGAEAFNLVAALNAVVAQRLAKRICENCKMPDPNATPAALIDLGIPEKFANKITAMKGKGCDKCSYLGAKGRTGVHEVMVLNDQIKQTILEGKSAIEIKRVAMLTGMRTLRQNALNKLAQGMISAAEVTRVTTSDREKEKPKKEKLDVDKSEEAA